MRRVVALSHWLLVCRSFVPTPSSGQPAQPGPISSDALALAAQVSRWLSGWLEALCIGRYMRNCSGFTPGRLALLADDQALRPFAPGDLTGWSAAQAQRLLARELERLVRLLEAPLMQFHPANGSDRWEQARWSVIVCLARLGQVYRQAEQTQGAAGARRTLEAALRSAHP